MIQIRYNYRRIIKVNRRFYDMKLFNQTIAHLTIALLIIYVSVKKKEISCIYALLAMQ